MKMIGLMELSVNTVKQVKMLHVVMLLLFRFLKNIFELELPNATQRKNSFIFNILKILPFLNVVEAFRLPYG